MIDPRTSVIDERLSKIGRIVAVSSGKGGVGKSMVATTLALTLAKQSCRVGLFDLDFTSPSTHIILGSEDVQPKEENGLVPPMVHGLKFMSIIYFVGNNPAPLRGVDTSNALIELLTITQWDELDFLIIDMPPGIGDVVLDLVRLIRRIEFLIVTTPSLLAFETVKKQVSLLLELKMRVIGIVENMKMDQTRGVQIGTEKLGLKYLGEVAFDPQVEASIGNEQKLLGTAIGRKMVQIVQTNILTESEKARHGL